jgi:hypothetical protein
VFLMFVTGYPPARGGGRHSPAHHGQFTLGASVPDDRSRIVGKDARPSSVKLPLHINVTGLACAVPANPMHAAKTVPIRITAPLWNYDLKS